ncbi:hypothetical protein M0804_002816 [Polistes exclamans]|nr:hypothetical protein M0804_002816 [Polistes exclamans]
MIPSAKKNLSNIVSLRPVCGADETGYGLKATGCFTYVKTYWTTLVVISFVVYRRMASVKTFAARVRAFKVSFNGF